MYTNINWPLPPELVAYIYSFIRCDRCGSSGTSLHRREYYNNCADCSKRHCSNEKRKNWCEDCKSSICKSCFSRKIEYCCSKCYDKRCNVCRRPTSKCLCGKVVPYCAKCAGSCAYRYCGLCKKEGCLLVDTLCVFDSFGTKVVLHTFVEKFCSFHADSFVKRYRMRHLKRLVALKPPNCKSRIIHQVSHK